MITRASSSIYFKLACLVLACVFPVWLMSGFLVLRGYSLRCEQVNEAMLESARTLTMVVDRELSAVQAALFALATSPAFAAGDLGAVHRQAQQLLKSYPEADIIVADSTGQQVVNSFRPFGVPLPKRKNPETVRRIFSEGKPVISNLFFGAVTHRPLISIDIPVVLEGKVAYDLAMTFPSDRVATILARHSLPPGRYCAILDGKQTLVARSSHQSLVGSTASDKLRAALSRAPEGIVEMKRNLEGKPVFVAFSRSAICNWNVVVGVPKATVLAGIYRWLGWAVTGVGALSLFGILLALRFARKIASAIRSLVPAALAIGSDSLPITDDTRSIRETGEVARALVKASEILKRGEDYKELAREILQILSSAADMHDLIGQVLSCLKSKGEFDAVGVRLRNHEDFPYFEQYGFSSSFLATENTVLEHGTDGKPCRDPEGKVSLSCACGMVLSGRPEPWPDFFTPGGSFWTNDLDSIAESPDAGERLRRPRLVCRQEGYRSLALVPIRNGDTILGLIQFNSRDKGRLSLEVVELLEGIAGQIGAGLVRRHAEEERRRLEEQLQHAQKLESVGRLAGGVAHDFNNMLGVILGHANLALMDLAPEQPLYATMSEIRKAAERSAELTRQLLAFARKQPITPTEVKLDQAVAGMLSMLKRIIGEDITLNWQPEADIWPVKLDRSQFDQVLVNLCINARDAIGGVGAITIQACNTVIGDEYRSLYKGMVPGEYVRLTVSDTGCGMDRETVSLIFEPFFTTKGTGKGTGLGLATVFGAVKQNNGFIYVYSEPGVGSTFSVFFPPSTGAAAPTRPEGVESPAQRGHETILLVEDEPAILNVATLILTRQGYSVLAAESPSAALELADRFAGKISLLLTDVIMPEMNGRDLVRELHSRYPQVKRLFMSGFPADVIANHGVIDDGVHFIQKPFSVNSLSAKVREVLDGV